MMRRLLTASVLATVCLLAQAADNDGATGAWSASASDQVQAQLRRDAGDDSLCLDYDFAGVSGYAVMRRKMPLDWPDNFEIKTRVKGTGGVNDLQLKFIDASGENVWWINRPNFRLPTSLGPLAFGPRHMAFAWGPTSDKRLRRTETIEFVVSAGQSGGRGSLCVAQLERAELPPDPAVWPQPQRRMVDARLLELDWQRLRDINGLALRWPVGLRGLDYDVLASDEGRDWRLLRRVRGGAGGLAPLYLEDGRARLIRVQQTAGPAVLAQLVIELRSADQWPTANAALTELARTLPPGALPRSLVQQQSYWTLVGVDGGGAHSALMGEDGALEMGRGGYSVEPAVRLPDGKIITWADTTQTHSLREGYLPLPGVRWEHADFRLDIEAAADGPPTAPALLARYTLHNKTARPQTFTLVLLVRPWQVNPPQQFLTTPGGISPIGQLQWRAGRLRVNGRASLQPDQAAQVQALPFDAGLALEDLLAGPALTQLNDPQQMASASLQFPLALAPGAQASVGWTAPLAGDAAAPADSTGASVAARMDAVAAGWRERLNRTALNVPAPAQPVADSLRTALAHMLMSRDGPALRPGTRSYARTWVRDGAMMVAALVRLRETEVARAFVEWYGTQIFASGKVPCCVDARGADPVTENDSHGQYLYAVAEVWRHTRDRAWLARQWPLAQKVATWIERQRQSERTDANRLPPRTRFFGLMPPSISHEGYSDKPAYAYWDNFWTLRGLKDVVLMAQALELPEQAARWSAARDEFQRELVASVAATAQHYQITHIAGAADRGDFDATSTTIALNPAQAQDDLPAGLLQQTFATYWRQSEDRASGRRESKDYTPYELRTVGALLRLGQVEQAHAMLRFFFADQRPPGWNQWAEVVLPAYREPRFLGDMPHAWVSSDYIRSALDLFAYEREPQGSLLIGAGITPEWRAAGAIEVRNLSTAHGLLDYRLAPVPDGWELTLPASVQALQDMPGGLWLAWPGNGPLPRAASNGQPLPWQGRALALPPAPARITLFSHPTDR